MKKKSTFIKPVILSALAVAVIVAVALILFLPSKTETIQYDVMDNGIKGDAILIRSEIAQDLSGYEKLYFNHQIDGQAVSADEQIVLAYKKGYIQSTLTKLYETQKNIVIYQNQSVVSGFDDAFLTDVDFRIQVLIDRMTREENGFIELYGELCDLMQEREDHIRLTYNTDSNTYMQGLYSDEKMLMDSLQSWCDTFTAPQDGYIGFYCDGLESTLTPEKAQSMAYGDIKSFFKKENENKGTGYKIVTDTTWYIAMNVSDDSGFVVGSSYPLYIGNEMEAEIGTLEKTIKDKKGCILLFSLSEKVEKYIDIRSASVLVGTRVCGYTVPVSCVHQDSITVKTGSGKQTVPIQVLYSDGKKTAFAITDEVSLGQTVYR